MTGPIPQLPHPSLGNVATDASSGIASFVQGLQAQRLQDQQMALARALAEAKLFAAQKGERPFSITTQTPQGLRHGIMDPYSGETKLATGEAASAPESQILLPTQGNEGTPGFATIPRYIPGQPAQPVSLPPGQVGRMEAPVIQTTESPKGPVNVSVQRRTGAVTPLTGQGGQPLRPRAEQFEVEKAQFASNMARAAHGMESTPPGAVDRVIGRLNTQAVLSQLPVVGAPIGEVIRSAMAMGLSADEAKWLANFYTFVGFAVPEMAGKQMTITEMRQQMAMFAPLLSEPPESRQLKINNIRSRVQAAIAASGSGWQRLVNDPNVASQIPLEYGGGLLDQQPAKSQSRYGYTRPD